MRKWVVVAIAILIAALAGASVYFRPDRAIRLATGFVAHNVCSKTFVSGLDPQVVFAEFSDRAGIRRLRHVLRFDLDRTARTVDASTLGLFRSRAAFHDGLGCVELHGSKPPYLLKNDVEALKAKTPPLLPEIAGPALVEPSDPALKAALDHAFEEPATPPFRRTKAVVVVHDGKVIAERYAAGVGIDTPLPGFSMTKSVVNALIGILTQQGLVTPSMPAPIPEWRGADDPRREIEVEHLMRMTTGLDLDETNSGFDRSSRMFLAGRHGRLRRECEDDRAAGPALALFEPDHADPGAHRSRRRRRAGADAGVRVARIVQSARHAQRHAGVRWRRHAAGRDQYAGERAGLGEIRPALSQ